MDNDLIEKGLLSTSMPQERIAALTEAGLDIPTIAETVGTSETSVRNWKTGEVEPRKKNAIRLDDLRYAMSNLVLAGLKPDEAAMWLQSRTATPPFDRPVDLIRDHPEAAFKIIAESFELPTS